LSKKTILITGVTGYLGSHLAQYWFSQGHSIVALKRSKSDTSRLKGINSQISIYNIDETDISSIMNRHTIDVVIHAATSYGRKQESLVELIMSNVVFPVDLLENSISAGIKHFINIDTSLRKSVNTYSLSKGMFRDVLLGNDKINVLNVELQYFYGPDDSDWKFITHVYNQLLKRAPEIKFTSGKQKRDFIYIDDVVNAFDILLNDIDRIKKNSSIEIGSGSSVSIKEIACLIKELLDNRETVLNFGAITDRKNEDLDMYADTSYLESLGWKPSHSLREGLNKIIRKG
jgi:CDP-paratose synthetase